MEKNNITISIFGKTRTSKNGTTYVSYSGKLTKKTGEDVILRVKFRRPCEGPDKSECPIIISVPRETSNISKRNYVDSNTGELKEQSTLWVQEYTIAGPYIDHSLDDFI